MPINVRRTWESGIVDDNLKLSRSRSIAERRQADATRENRVKRILMMVFLVGVSIACFWQAIADVFTPPRPPHKAARRIQRILTVPRLVRRHQQRPRGTRPPKFVRSRWRNKSVDNEHRSNCSTMSGQVPSRRLIVPECLLSAMPHY